MYHRPSIIRRSLLTSLPIDCSRDCVSRILREIPFLCEDRHGCRRYLPKKLEEGVPDHEHRDMVFRETFGHFLELMVGPGMLSSGCFRSLPHSPSFSGSIRQLSLPEATRILF